MLHPYKLLVKVFHSFHVRECNVPFQGSVAVQSWVFSRSYDREEVSPENPCGMGNEDDSVQFVPKV